MLNRNRNKKTAKRFFKKTLSNSNVTTPYAINVDKNPAYPSAHQELQNEGRIPNARLRQVKYLNNGVENDHKSMKSKLRYRQWYQSFETAQATIDGMETMRMIQKNSYQSSDNGYYQFLFFFLDI